MCEAIVGGLISAFIAVAFVIWMEKLRKPKLRLRIKIVPPHDYGEKAGKPARIIRVCSLYLKNENLPKCLRWCMSRNAAVHCYGYITFHKKDGDNIFSHPMPIKWSKKPRLEVYPGGTEIEHPLYEVSYIDVHPGEEESLDVVARFDNDSECYGWNNEAYYFKWRNKFWEIKGPDDYFTRVKVISAGLRCEEVFKVHIGSDPDDFKLEQAEKRDKDRISKSQNEGRNICDSQRQSS